jgi:hypothetical protein
MRRALVASLLTLGVASCAGDPEPARSAASRDSALAESEVLPGAAGVGAARRAADTARARNALRDSLATAP